MNCFVVLGEEMLIINFETIDGGVAPVNFKTTIRSHWFEATIVTDNAYLTFSSEGLKGLYIAMALHHCASTESFHCYTP